VELVERDSKSLLEKPSADDSEKAASPSPSDDGGSEDDGASERANPTKPDANVDDGEGDDIDVDDAEDDDEKKNDRVSFLERDLARLARVDWFTGAPFLETEVTHAVALVAPWDALKAFAYKAKLTPGSQKKGKAAKQALEIVTRAPPAADVMRETREARGEEKNKKTRAEDETEAASSAPIGDVDETVEAASECAIESGRSRNERFKPETRREKAARADRDDALKRVIAAAAAAAAAGDGAMLMCGQGVKVSMPAGAAKAMNASRKGGKRGN